MVKLGAKIDLRSAVSGLDQLNGALRESLARRMAVSGGQILRDEAKARVPNTFTGAHNDSSRGSQAPGTLRDAIYLAYNDRRSTQTMFTYSVSWNDKKAWWGKLIEFGHYLRYAYVIDANGVYHTLKDRPLANPRWIEATPFLAPAYDASLQAVRAAMIERGKTELPILLREIQ